jgi:hypothetical protein
MSRRSELEPVLMLAVVAARTVRALSPFLRGEVKKARGGVST